MILNDRLCFSKLLEAGERVDFRVPVPDPLCNPPFRFRFEHLLCNLSVENAKNYFNNLRETFGLTFAKREIRLMAYVNETTYIWNYDFLTEYFYPKN